MGNNPIIRYLILHDFVYTAIQKKEICGFRKSIGGNYGIVGRWVEHEVGF